MKSREQSALAAASLRDIAARVHGYDPDALTIDAAQAAIHACIAPVADSEMVDLTDSLGRVLAGAIVSPIDLPGHDNSAMDGWALRSADLHAGRHTDGETHLTQVGAALAGHPYSGTVGAGECVRIMTGAMLPSGADSVVVQEIVRAYDDGIVIPPGEHAGRNVRRKGEDLQRGAVALPAGLLLRPASIGLAASLGIQSVLVRRRLRVAFFSTGDELRTPGEALRPGDIYDSNRHTVRAMLQRLGCEIMDLGAIGDDPAKLEAAFRQAAASADVVITTGGVSAGDYDFTRPLMQKLGEVLFWKVAIRPGRPMAFGRISAGGNAKDNAAFLFALPGNPVAVMVTFYQFVRGALLAMMGHTPATPLALSLPLQHALRKKPGRTEFLRGIVELKDGLSSVRSTGSQGSAMLSSMCDANCFIVLGHAQGDVQTGERVEVMLFEGLI